MALAKGETKKNILKSTAKQEKKPQSTFQTLKQSLKLSNSNKKIKQSTAQPSNETSKPVKVRNRDLSMKKSGVQRKRISTQRFSLFTYNNVQVMNSFVPVHNDSQYNSTIVRRNSQVSTNNASKASKGSFNDALSQDSQNTIKLKPTSLMAKGPIEIYQICTGFGNLKENVELIQKSSKDSSHDGHVVNYLSIGRHGDIVHPVLPKLQITRLNGTGYKYFISFYNPERYWEIEFLPIDNQTRSDLENKAKDFENIISKICQFSQISEEDTIGNNESLSDKFATSSTSIVKSPNIEIGDDDGDGEDELNYLLDEEDEPNKTKSVYPVPFDSYSNITTKLDYPNGSTDTMSSSINEAFKNAMRRTAPILNTPVASSMHLQQKNKRYSSYSFVNFSVPLSDRHRRFERRYISRLGDL
ncbi:hypothetical protein SEUBUCD646_0M03420 [Saccharomyces eubayanus]|uniref:Inheritance of peroxisomes protein 1 n=1 Tax=Saccharomyces eubayanus TaxID=1080349 RepID=A0ABN8VKQ5_SACEU|nr:hypothetical protein SEUBUCD650_0M03360 [Saccharomyces eubayanus]CAI1676901.1 hypothetical protein SEUBUCD646_0M03420 [Saccharomyces eubayanus]